MVALGVIQQYYIYLKTAIFYEKSSEFTYLGLADAPASWYNTVISKSYTINGRSQVLFSLLRLCHNKRIKTIESKKLRP